jgi:hypothetical protein
MSIAMVQYVDRNAVLSRENPLAAELRRRRIKDACNHAARNPPSSEAIVPASSVVLVSIKSNCMKLRVDQRRNERIGHWASSSFFLQFFFKVSSSIPSLDER